MAGTATVPVATPILLTNPAVPVRFGRPLALLTLACLVAHVPLIASHLTTAPVTSIVMALVSMACIPCARTLWLAPTTQDCATAAALAAAMMGLHLFLSISMAGSVTPATNLTTSAHHQRGGASAMDPRHTGMPMGDMSHMTTTPAVQALFYLATVMAVVQVLLNGLAIATTVRRLKAGVDPAEPRAAR
jgi:hypothetical protein